MAGSSVSHLEEMLHLKKIEPDLFTSGEQLWHPPGGRGIYGGVIAGLCIRAAQHTISDGFSIHATHCYFLEVGDSKEPVEFSVQRVRDGKSFITRNVIASQGGNPICSSTVSFARDGTQDSRRPVQHGPPMSEGLHPPPEDRSISNSHIMVAPQMFPVDIEQVHGPPHGQVMRIWIRSPEKIAEASNHALHQVILAFLSDWVLMPAVPIVNNLWKFPDAIIPGDNVSAFEGSELGMLFTLNHAMFFHEPLEVKADEWMLLETNSPWAGKERGLVTSKVFSKGGILLATCIQEGGVRLKKTTKVMEAKI
ncbi:thioesterase-like superfamily-domain-containing protein [Ilyonectria sp. MPI-CAGE-AT-0026]|nr:thioesterase-like superfamily-domain-containing protein [Ilyonectria sp. MPI-CAGE-AT-0026]